MISNEHLYSLVEVNLHRNPEAVVFVEDNQKTSFREFDELCQQKEQWLRSQGIAKGDAVAMWLVNSRHWLAFYFALARIGATLVPLNTRYKSHEIGYMINKSQPRLLIMQNRFRKIDFADMFLQIGQEELNSLEVIAYFDPGETLPEVLQGIPVTSTATPGTQSSSEDSPDVNGASILFSTSGTTSDPKLVMQTQANLVRHAHYCAKSYGMTKPASSLLSVLPFCGAFGLNAVLAAMAAGCPTVIMAAFDGSEAALLAQKYSISHIYGSDELYRKLIDAAEGDQPFPMARLFGFGAFTSSFKEYALAAWERGIPLCGLYGSSEVMAIFSAQTGDMPVREKIQGGGVPAAQHRVQLRIRDSGTGKLLPAGEAGEIEITGPTNFIGYLNNPEATEKAFTHDGFYRTGDLGYLRPDGSLVYESRMGDSIRLGGFLVSPSEIEAVLKDMPAVEDAYIVGVEVEGKLRVVAFIKDDGRATLSEQQVIDNARQHLAAFKVPYKVWSMDEYPVTQSANGLKVQRGKLRALAEANLAEGESATRAGQSTAGTKL
jgi:fatty-acyl-CoA synthase